MKYKAIIVLALLLTSCSMSTPNANIPLTPTSAAPNAMQTFTGSTVGLTYTVAVPAVWDLVREDAGGLRFQQGEVAVAPADRSDDQAYIGGVTILSRCTNESTVDSMYACVLPNHSTVYSVDSLTTSVGEGRVYMLEHSYPVGDQRRWWAQHALIPVQQYILDVWVQVEAETDELPATVLLEMLDTLQVTKSNTTSGNTSVAATACCSTTTNGKHDMS